jgi:UDP-2-acetamido-2,6-beta-L-arabino-hexul-4-ose reductase
MKRIGITGQNGFIGNHLLNTLKLFPTEFEITSFKRSYFENEDELDSFTRSCEVIVHLAALNRHNDPNTIYRTNVDLVNRIKDSLIRTNSKAHILVSSSIQEERDNVYGQSKKEGRLILSKWASENQVNFTGMLIPNVFGPFGHPFYNSVIATFCYQVSRNETPKIEVDRQLNLIYVDELVEKIITVIRNEDNTHELQIPHTAEVKISEILALLQQFNVVYQENGKFPFINSPFEHNLFNTYRSFIDISKYFPRKYKQYSDSRGTFVEIARHSIAGQTSFSNTVPGTTRGNHFHTRKIERFAVIKGKALIQLRRIGTDKVIDFLLDGENPAYVDMPIWYTHNIQNIGTDDLYTIFWINEPYDPTDPDTYLETV